MKKALPEICITNLTKSTLLCHTFPGHLSVTCLPCPEAPTPFPFVEPQMVYKPKSQLPPWHSSPRAPVCVGNTYLNKCVCFSHVNLSFACLIYSAPVNPLSDTSPRDKWLLYSDVHIPNSGKASVGFVWVNGPFLTEEMRMLSRPCDWRPL